MKRSIAAGSAGELSLLAEIVALPTDEIEHQLAALRRLPASLGPVALGRFTLLTKEFARRRFATTAQIEGLIDLTADLSLPDLAGLVARAAGGGDDRTAFCSRRVVDTLAVRFLAATLAHRVLDKGGEQWAV